METTSTTVIAQAEKLTAHIKDEIQRARMRKNLIRALMALETQPQGK